MDAVDFQRFVDTAEPLLQQWRDVMWVLAGRTDSNLAKLKQILAKSKLHVEAFCFTFATTPSK